MNDEEIMVLAREFRGALGDLCSDVFHQYNSLVFDRGQLDADMEVLIAAWYRLHVATEPQS